MSSHSATAATSRRAFAHLVRTELALNLREPTGLVVGLGLPVLLWDERWSTQSAERDLIDQDFSRAKRKERIDSAAAAVILQAAIDALAGGVI